MHSLGLPVVHIGYKVGQTEEQGSWSKNKTFLLKIYNVLACFKETLEKCSEIRCLDQSAGQFGKKNITRPISRSGFVKNIYLNQSAGRILQQKMFCKKNIYLDHSPGRIL